MTARYLQSSADLGRVIRELRPDAVHVAVITDSWCRDQMHILGVTRYEELTADQIDHIANAVDELAD